MSQATEPAANEPESNRFRRHRRKLIGAFLLACLVAVDTGGASLLDFARHRIERQRQELAARRDQQRLDTQSDEARYRRADPIYHHDLVPNASVEHASWALRSYPVRT